MVCEDQRAAWETADAQLQTSVEARDQSVAELGTATQARIDAQAALAEAETAEETAQASVDAANAQVGSDATAAQIAYEAYLECLISTPPGEGEVGVDPIAAELHRSRLARYRALV